MKKSAVASSSSSKPMVKKEIKPQVTAVKDAKSDSSFFSAPKPKPKLPSFRKAPVAPPVKKEPDLNIAQPSSIDPFQEALKSMKARKGSPMVTTPPPMSAGTSGTSMPGLTKTGKRKKSVRWRPDGQLEEVKLIDIAVYDDDPVDVSACLFLFISYCTLMGFSLGLHPLLLFRVYILHTTTAIWIEAKVLLCMHIYSKKLSTGLNPFVSKTIKKSPSSRNAHRSNYSR